MISPKEALMLRNAVGLAVLALAVACALPAGADYESGRQAWDAGRPDAVLRAASVGDVDGLNGALAAGAEVDARDGRGWTALMHAADKGYVLLVEPLLSAKADPNLRGADGATALFLAAVHGHTEIVVLLMEAGADVSIKGPKGKTAVDAARLEYGAPDAARRDNADPAVLALLEGRTLDEAAFARAEEAGTGAAYAAYLSLYPQGRHASEARRLRGSLEHGDRLAKKHPPGTRLRDCGDCPEMVVVPPRNYMMGSPSSGAGRDGEEGSVHRVVIGEPFAVGVKEVTRGEYRRFVRATWRSPGDSCWTNEDGEWEERGGRNWEDPGFEQTDGHPVVCVNWEDAKAYAGWLSRETGKEYRLLSESEWEYVARGGSGTARYWGEGEAGQCRYANGADKAVKGSYGDWKWEAASCNDGHVHTAPVGSFAANGYGLHDVLGNVWEWVEDCWNEGYAGAPSDGSAWESGDCSRRVLRGGSWGSGPGNLRSALRFRLASGNRSDSFGFRVARTLAP